MELVNESIRKITITKGDLKDGISYVLGNEVRVPHKKMKIVSIIRDDQYHEVFGDVCYSVYCIDLEEPNIAFKWKDLFGQPMVIEYEV